LNIVGAKTQLGQVKVFLNDLMGTWEKNSRGTFVAFLSKNTRRNPHLQSLWSTTLEPLIGYGTILILNNFQLDFHHFSKAKNNHSHFSCMKQLTDHRMKLKTIGW